MRWLPLALALTVTSGCNELTGPTLGLDERFTLAPQQTAFVRGPRAYLTFYGVDGDSRCPGDAVCIQGGDARVLIGVRTNGPERRYELHTGDMQPVTHGGLTVTMMELQPYPFGSLPPIQPGDYRVTLVVTD